MSTMPDTPTVLWDLQATLGEGVQWDPIDRRVWFVDVKQHRIHRCAVDGSERRSWDAPGQVSFVLPSADGGVVCGIEHGLYRFNDADGSFARLAEVEPEQPGNRLNDAYVDAQGRLWFGTMDDAEQKPTGALYRFDKGAITRMDTGYVVTNGPAASPDGRTLYHNDTSAKHILAFDLAPDGSLAGKRVFASVDDGGYPDGMAVDAEGCLWVCTFGGGRILRFDPQGRRIGALRFPCANVTRLTFGGADLRTVVATSARKGLSDAELAAQPLAGALFTFRAPVPGLAPHALRLGQ